MSSTANVFRAIFAVTLCTQLGCAVHEAGHEQTDGTGAQQADALAQAPSAPRDSGLAWAQAHDNHCLEQHLREALQVNLARRDAYAALSGGRTKALLSTMIGADRLGLNFAESLDAAGADVRGRSGVNIVCELVPSLSRAPATPRAAGPALRTPYAALPLPAMRRKLRALTRAHDWQGLAAQARAYAQASGDDAQRHCFTRQAFRTMARLGEVVQEHNTRDADAFAERAMNLMLPMTRFSALTDKMAAESQADGVPILCADMPALPTF